MINIGLAEWVLPCMGREAFILAKSIGVVELQVDIGKPDLGQRFLPIPSVLNEYRNLTKEYSISISAVTANILNDCRLTSNNGEYEDKLGKNLIDMTLNVAEQLKAKLIYFPCFRTSRIRNDSDVANVSRKIKAACIKAEAQGIFVAVECVLDSNLLNKMIRLVDRENFCLIMDVCNLFDERLDPVEQYKYYSKYFSPQIHIKNRSIMGNSINLKRGKADYIEIITEMRKIKEPELLVLENNYALLEIATLKDDVEFLKANFVPDYC